MTKIIFFDIDGTLQTLGVHGDKTYVPDSCKVALKKLRENGIKVCIASGRPISIIPEIEQKCDFEFDGYVMMNGQYCFTKDCIVRKCTIPKDQLAKALEFCIQHQIPTTVAEENYIYNIKEVNATDGYYENIDTFKRVLEHETFQVMPQINEKDVDLEKEFFTILTSCKSARWIDFFMDVIPKDGGKNTGIDAMIDHFGIDLSQTMAIGDGGNDISMLQHCAIGIAMGNAKDNVKASADLVTDHIEQDGVYNILHKLELI